MTVKTEIPTLYDVLDKFVNSRLASIHTAMPAKVLSYDKTKKVCSVKPLLKKELESNEFVELPVIDNVPILFLQTIATIISIPIKKGDGVLLVFIERSIDDWKTKGGIVEPEDPRKFDISDAVAIPGLFPKSQGVAADEDDILIEHTNGNVKINSSGDVILNAGTKGVARLDDTVTGQIIVPGGSSSGTYNLSSGKIASASSKVKAG